MCAVTCPYPLVSQEKTTDPANAAAAPPASSADVVTVPDGKPVETKLTKDLSTATAKVGDDVELTVAQGVLQDNLVIIPKGAVLSAKITSVRHAGRPLKDGRVRFSVENAVLPGGETAALRPEPPATAGQNLRGGVAAMGHVAVDPELPPGVGIVLLAASPVALFWKGHERTLYAGRITTLYLHGPLYLKRDEVLKVQPPPYKGPAQVFYQNRAYTKEADASPQFYCGQMPLGKVIANQVLQLELSPGTYWLSAGNGGKEKLRLEVEADHRYYVERGAQGLFLKNFDDYPWLLDEDAPLRHRLDFTSASPEQTADLLALPLSHDAAQSSH
jgi:hypothetical protein